MKNNIFLYFVCVISTVLLIGCNGNQKSKTVTVTDSIQTVTTTDTDYSGVYKSNSEATACDLTITITKENEAYKYNLTGEQYDDEGIVIIEEEDATYITFDGPIGNNELKTVSGQIEGNVITIQNYGNSMNSFNIFVECEDKYLQFVK